MPEDFSDVQGGGSSTAPRAPQSQQTQREYEVKKGDSLSKIAKAVYGDMHRWKDIYDANRERIGDNPDLIQPGWTLRIP